LWGIGTLVNEGFLNIKFVDRLMGNTKMTYWEKVKALVPTRRQEKGPEYAEDLEYLCNEIIRRRRGISGLAD